MSAGLDWTVWFDSRRRKKNTTVRRSQGESVHALPIADQTGDAEPRPLPGNPSEARRRTAALRRMLAWRKRPPPLSRGVRRSPRSAAPSLPEIHDRAPAHRRPPPRPPHRPRHRAGRRLCLAQSRQLAGGDARSATLAADIRGYLEAENAYTKVEMADTEALQALLFKEMRGRIKEDDSSVPAPDGPFAYATRFLEGAEQPRIVRTPRAGGAEEVLIDVDALAKGHAYYDLGGADHSPDHALMAWSYDDKGSESYTLRVRDLSTGADLDDRIETTTGGAVWSADSRTLFYTVLDDNHRPCRIYRHRVGAPTSEDVLVFEETIPATSSGSGRRSRRAISSSIRTTTRLRSCMSSTPRRQTPRPRLIARGGRPRNMTSSTMVTSSTSSPMRMGRRTSRSSPPPSPHPAARTGPTWCRTGRGASSSA